MWIFLRLILFLSYFRYAPERFWDYYPIVNISLPPHKTLPTGVPAVALQNWQVKSWCTDTHDSTMLAYCGPDGEKPLTEAFPLDNTTLPDKAIKSMRQAYFAATSWTDANIGKVLDAFEHNFEWNNTVVVMWGDHG